MQSLWNDADAIACVRAYGELGVSEDLALRTYSARLLGANPSLVLHGGGNTSVKTKGHDIFGDPVDLLHVKGSGWDLATIEPAGHPAVRLEPLLRLRSLAALSDEAMVNAQRQNLMDSSAPNPSVETLLHAFIPRKFIDHTHATAVLALANQPDAAALIKRVFGDRVACVRYVAPGFDLAKVAADAWDQAPTIEGLVLLNHGLFTFGDTAQQSYQRMIDLVSQAEAHVAEHRRAAPSDRQASPPTADLLPTLRGALSRVASGHSPGRWLLDLRTSAGALEMANHDRLAELAGRGVATPDHVIRTKSWPLVAPRPDSALLAWRAEVTAAVEQFADRYRDYFKRNADRTPQAKTMLDPLPRVVVIPNVGLVGIGRSAAEAAIAADIAETWAETVLAAEAVGRFEPIGEADTFDMEYWVLEQAKLGKQAEPRLLRHVVVITGGAGAIGAATGRAFASEGAQVVLLDRDEDAAKAAARGVGRGALALHCDVTDNQSVVRAFDEVARTFGGVDIVVSNAGIALSGAMIDLPDEDLRASFEVNLFSHQAVARAAIKIMREQGMGGVLLFNVSKQALNPGADFGAYGASKAALLALARQYAIEHGKDGVRVNMINPDRIRSGLLTDEMIRLRSAARGLDAAAYMAGNLLGREVTANDVAQAFVFAALMPSTTGAVITVDGGNTAAMVR